MIRRFSAILTSLLVLTFSMSGWTNVCAQMSSNAESHATHVAAAMSQHEAGSGSHSHHAPGTGGGTNHCQHATSCSGSTLAPVIDREIPLVSPAGYVLPPNESLPSSESADLEPPPPKA